MTKAENVSMESELKKELAFMATATIDGVRRYHAAPSRVMARDWLRFHDVRGVIDTLGDWLEEMSDD